MITYRKADDSDLKFLKEMLFEAVFWSRNIAERPTLEEGLSYDYTRHILKAFGSRHNDLAIIAERNGQKIGAAFIRCWNEKAHVRGYLEDDIPVLVIGVVDAYRHQGIGLGLLEGLKSEAKALSIEQISLCVTKSNVALGLYEKSGFKIVEDIDDSYNMLWQSH